MLLLYRNQSIDLHSKSIDWFLYESNNGIFVNVSMNEFYLFFTKQLHPFKNFPFPPFLWTPSFLQSLLILNDFLNPSHYAHFGKLYPPSAKDKGEGRKLCLHNSFKIHIGAYNFWEKSGKFAKFGHGNRGRDREFYYWKSLVTLYMYVSNVCCCLKKMLQICIDSNFAGLKIYQCTQCKRFISQLLTKLKLNQN